MIDVSFEHWRFTFPDALLARYGSPHYSRKEAGNEYAHAISSSAVRAASIEVQFHEAQILCGNEAFPEAAVADPVADLEVWDEWGSGKRYFPYPGRYSKLGITHRDDKTSSPSSVGVVGEILTGFFAQAGVSPWVLVRVVRRWPDFIFSHRNGTYSFVESKAFTGDPEGSTGLRARVLDGLLVEGAVQAAQQLNSDPFGRVWCSFTRIRRREDITPMRFEVTFLELSVSDQRRASQVVRVMPASVAEGLAERAVNQAAARLEMRSIADIQLHAPVGLGGELGALQHAAEEEIPGLLAETSEGGYAEADRGPIVEAVARIIRTLTKRRAKVRRPEEREGRRLEEAKEAASGGQLSRLREAGGGVLLLADLPRARQEEVRRAWSPDWSAANRPWAHLGPTPLWRCGGALFCLGSGELAGRSLTSELSASV
jgi:hypothetical protein